MMKTKKVKIELYHNEFEALKANGMISGTCGEYLASAERHGDYIVLDLSIHEANDLLGWVACDAIEAQI